MDRHTVAWIAYKNETTNFFDDAVTRNYFSLINPKFKPLNKNQLSSKVISEFQKMRENLKNILKKNTSKFAFTIDGWSSLIRKSYYGITIHYIDEKWEIRSETLGFLPSKGKHKGKDIADIFFYSGARIRNRR